MSNEVNPVNLEILRIAKDLVINEYTDRRAQDHNKWLRESEEMWRNKQVKLPYPDIPPYPTEVDIVKRAQTLFAFLTENRPVEQPEQRAEPISVETSKNIPMEETNNLSEESNFTEKKDLLDQIREKEKILEKLKNSEFEYKFNDRNLVKE